MNDYWQGGMHSKEMFDLSLDIKIKPIENLENDNHDTNISNYIDQK